MRSDADGQSWALPQLAQQHYQVSTWLAICFGLAILLLPVLLFLPDNDQALFFVSGRKLLAGSAYYRDVVEIKPPLIYYMYAFSIALFGDAWRSFRILDFLVQAATCVMMMRLVRRASGNDLWAAVSAAIYIVFYVGLSHNFSALTESFMGLFCLPMLWLVMYRRDKWGLLFTGMLAGGLILLKFTMAVIVLVPILAELLLFRDDVRTAFGRIAVITIGFALSGSLLVLYLLVFGAVHDFFLVSQFLQGYVKINAPSVGSAVKYAIQTTSLYLGEYFTLAATVLTSLGVVRSFLQHDSSNTDSGKDALLLLRLSTIAIPVVVLSVCLEQKYAPLHFSRIFPFVAIISAYVLLMLVNLMTAARVHRRYLWSIGGSLAIILTLLSPLPRYARHYIGAVYSALYREEGFDRYYGGEGARVTRTEYRQIGEYVAAHRKPDDGMFVASSAAGVIYMYADVIPDFKILHSAFLIAPFAPQQWRDETRAYLLEERPRFILIQRGDSIPSITASSLNSEQAIRALPGVDSMLHANYRTLKRTRWFDLLELDRPT